MVSVEAIGVEADEVDSVAKQHYSVTGGQVPFRHQVSVFWILDQLGVGEPGGEGFEGVDDQPANPWVIGGGIEAMNGVDYARDAAEAPENTSVQTWLGVVGVEDVEAFSPQDSP